VKHADQNVGTYATVSHGGRVTCGDPIVLE
jgi:hypothetical protein